MLQKQRDSPRRGKTDEKRSRNKSPKISITYKYDAR